MKKILLLSVISLCYAASALAQKKYNVVFIAVDDLSIAFDAYGNPDAPTPNFKRLMKHGMLFRQTYCQYAYCNPSRASILSGKRPDATGVTGANTSIRSVLGKDYRFLPEYFHDNGYHTEKWGKVTCGHEDEIFWDYVGKVGGKKPEGEADVPHWYIDTNIKRPAQTMYGLLTDSVIQKLVHPPVDKPYFYALGLSTHIPWTPTLAMWNKIGDPTKQELLPVDFDTTYTDVVGNGSANIGLPDTPPDDTVDIPSIARNTVFNYTPLEVQRLRHAYYAEIIQLDKNLKALLDKMDNLNLWDNTVVVFFSDHGMHLGEHSGLWLKVTLFEESLRVPFLICAPGKKTGICTTPVELVDLYSTLAELCGMPIPAGQEGSSLVPLLENPKAPWKKAIFAQARRGPIMARSVRTNNFHYNSWLEYGEELYDIKNDPHEYTNLATDPAHNDVLKKMRRLLANGWQGALPPVYPLKSFFRDTDLDGYGTNNDSVVAYFSPDGYALKGGDCNDNNANIHLGAKENPCNGKDDNCDGSIEENRLLATITPLGSLDICSTNSVILQANKGQDLNYQWKRNGTDIPGATSRTYTASIAGRYEVALTRDNGCSSTSDNVPVTNTCGNILTNGLASLSQLTTASTQEFLLYPNPADDNIYISFNSENVGLAQLRVFDMEGRVLVNTTKYVIKQNNTYKLNVSNLKPGMYYLEFNNGNLQKRIKKFLIGR